MRVITPTAVGRSAANRRTGGFLGIENKFYDTSIVGAVLTAPTGSTGGEHNPSATIALNTVTRGDGESQRNGKDITMNNIGIRGHIRVPPKANLSAADNGVVCYVALVLNTQTNGALLNSEDVFKNISADGLLMGQPWRNLQFTSRFKVLASKMVVFARSPELTWDGTNMEQGGLVRPFQMFVDLKGLKVHYSSASTETIANIIDNSLNIVAFSNGTGLAPVLSYSARLRFVG